MDIRTALSEIFLFDSLSDEQLDAVADVTKKICVEKGEHLFMVGEQAKAFFAVLHGKLKIYKVSPTGDEFIVHIQKPGDMVAEAAIFSLKKYPASCQALEDTALLRIPSNDFIDLIHSRPDLALRIMNSYSKRLRSFVDRLEYLSLHDVKARLANWLLNQAAVQGECMVCPLSITKRELASYLGTIPETLSRTLRHFKDKGILTELPDGFRILKPAYLRGLVR